MAKTVKKSGTKNSKFFPAQKKVHPIPRRSNERCAGRRAANISAVRRTIPQLAHRHRRSSTTATHCGGRGARLSPPAIRVTDLDDLAHLRAPPAVGRALPPGAAGGPAPTGVAAPAESTSSARHSASGAALVQSSGARTGAVFRSDPSRNFSIS